MEHRAVMSQQKIDERVIVACQRGDREAFRLLFEAYKDRVYSIAFYYFSHDETLAGDITQLVFLKLITRMRQFRNQAEFTTWLYRLTVNACLDEQRKQRRFVPFADAGRMNKMIERRSQEEHTIRLEIEDSVKAAIATLKPKLRLVILLKYFEDLSYDEMAAALGCRPGTVASRLNRAHKLLARKLAHLRGVLVIGESS